MKVNKLPTFVDQPVLLSKLNNAMPGLLIGVGGAYWAWDSYKNSRGKADGEKKNVWLKNGIIIASTIGMTLLGTRFIKLGKEKKPLIEIAPLEEALKNQVKAIDGFIAKKITGDKSVLDILEKAKKSHLSTDDIDTLCTKLDVKNYTKLPESDARHILFKEILPKPKNLIANEISSKIGALSLLGLIPVVGGIAGGVIADIATGTWDKKREGDKLKEGAYQYLANIFLCNVGAWAFLFASEKMVARKIIKPPGPYKRLAIILSGIAVTGIIGGSFIANLISKYMINPILDGKKADDKGIYDERHPEALDIALHADDIATAGVLAGFKWIEPALPFMYFISGYRAGIGYRNGHGHHHGHRHHHGHKEDAEMLRG